MIKFLTFLAIISLTSSLYALNLDSYKSTVTRLSGSDAVVSDNPTIKLGSSAIIIHNYDDKHRTIIAKAVADKREGGELFLKLYYYKDLNQDALPSYKIIPQVGDSVIFNYLYKRVLPIVPNKAAFKSLKQRFSNIDFLHPDLFAYQLAKDSNPKPTVSDFRAECNSDDFGLLLFNIEDKGYFVDCTSFKVIHSFDMPIEGEMMSPFYTRIKEIKAKFFGLGSDDMKEYNSYYKKLLGL
ncbi:MAG TPA: hypothetical protein EYG69_01855 [Campylobacterales bacterium]|nr:hypothetical protein [Campylobacterales bacterium]